MATFRVGQRVRIKSSYRQENIGREAIILGFEFHRSGSLADDGSRRQTDTDCAIECLDDGSRWTIHTSRLEPIQPSRNRVVSWESLNLPFDPRKVLEGVS